MDGTQGHNVIGKAEVSLFASACKRLYHYQIYRSLASVNETHTSNECGNSTRRLQRLYRAVRFYRAVQQPDCKVRALGWCSQMALWHKHPDEARAATALGWWQCSSASRRQRRQVHVHGPGPCVGWWQCSSASRWRQRIPKSTAAPPTASVGEENDAVPSCAAPRAAANSLGHLLSGHLLSEGVWHKHPDGGGEFRGQAKASDEGPPLRCLLSQQS